MKMTHFSRCLCYLLIAGSAVLASKSREIGRISEDVGSKGDEEYMKRLADQKPIYMVKTKPLDLTKRATNQSSSSVTLNDLVDVWDPYEVAKFWKNDTFELVKISAYCGKELTDYMTGLNDAAQWAVRMVDATGKHTWGLFSGNQFWLGSIDQCRDMEGQYYRWKKEQNIPRKSDVPPFPVSITSIKLLLDILHPHFKGTHNVTLALCLPSSCETHDVERLLYFLEDRKGKDDPKEIEIKSARNLSKGYNIWEDRTLYIMIITTAVVIVFLVLGTLYDVALRYQILREAKKKQSTENGMVDLKMSDGTDRITISQLCSVKSHNGSLDNCNPNDVPRPLSESLLSFSLLLNLSKLNSLEVGSDTLAPIHGLRFFSMLWVILVHSCITLNEVSDNTHFRKSAENDFFYQTISNGTYAVDTFFFMSGCLVAFLYYRTIAKENFQRQKFAQGFFSRILHFLGMMWYRYCRLTPPYLLVIGLTQMSMKWYHDHTVIEMFALDYKNCDKFWWRNALYINTYFDINERCITWSWYLANDTQFYTLGIILLIIGARYLSAAAFMTVFFLIASWISTAIITLSSKHVPSIQDPFADYDSLYDKPWARIGPYLIGMVAGWFLYKVDCKLKINKAVLAVGWSLCATTMISIVYGLYGKAFDPISAAMYTALSHSGWAVCIAWVVIVCVTGHGGVVNKILSWKYLYPASRLSYCTYLVHPLIMRAMTMRGESPIHLTQGFMAVMYFGLIVASYGVAFILSLLFEAPVVSILRIVHPLRSWKRWK